jgi:hypothetical protein
MLHAWTRRKGGGNIVSCAKRCTNLKGMSHPKALVKLLSCNCYKSTCQQKSIVHNEIEALYRKLNLESLLRERASVEGGTLPRSCSNVLGTAPNKLEGFHQEPGRLQVVLAAGDAVGFMARWGSNAWSNVTVR